MDVSLYNYYNNISLFSCYIDVQPNEDVAAGGIIIIDKEDKDTDIPSPFPFPNNYGTDLDYGISQKKLSPIQQTRFCSKIAGIMFLYKRQPTRKDFIRIAEECGRKYPFLVSSYSGTVSC